MPKKILHIASCDKFIPPFIDFIKEHFDFDEHEFLLNGGMAVKDLRLVSNINLAEGSTLANFNHYWQAIIKMNQADKVILHGLFDPKLVGLLFSMPWLLKKCYWVMWGGDLYFYQFGERNWKWNVREFFRRPVIRNMGHLVTYIEGDVDLARQWYGAEGQYHECIMYLSNVYKEYNIPKKQSSTINIQVGNSADPSNNHIEALEKIRPYKDKNICIFVPLSYGDQEHAKQVIKQGKEWFGEKFIPLIDFMPFDEYLHFLGSIDIAIFNHKRQQAMGNTITLLGLGKTVFIRSDTTQWQFFKDKKIEVYDVKNLSKVDLKNIKNNEHNIDFIKDYFSIKNLKSQLGEVFI